MHLPPCFRAVISIHALREEGDLLRFRVLKRPKNFYPRPPRGGRLVENPNGAALNKFLSTPSARRATGLSDLRNHWNQISIHALREEGDPIIGHYEMTQSTFLSTPSARRATASAITPSWSSIISIHALREEGDHHKRGEDGAS